MSALPRRPEFNHSVGILGRVKAGKSTRACALLLEFRRRHLCYLVAHDARHAIPDRLHDGRKLDIHRYPSVAELDRGIARHPEGIHVCTETDGLSTVRYAKQLARASMVRADPTHLARPCPPVVLYIDEVANVEGMKEGKLGDEVRDALLQRRHNHVGFIWSTQNPNRVHYDLLSDVTELHVARLEKARDLKRLDDDAGFSEAELARVRNLPPHTFHVHRI